MEKTAAEVDFRTAEGARSLELEFEKLRARLFDAEAEAERARRLLAQENRTLSEKAAVLQSEVLARQSDLEEAQARVGQMGGEAKTMERDASEREGDMSEAIERVRVLEQQSSEAALNVENERALVVERVGALEVELERMGALEVELKHEREKRVSAERQLGVETAENVEKTGALEVELERIRGQNLNRRWGEKPTAQVRVDEMEEERAEAIVEALTREAGADRIATLQQGRDTLFAQTLAQEEELKALRASLSRSQARAEAAEERAGALKEEDKSIAERAGSLRKERDVFMREREARANDVEREFRAEVVGLKRTMEVAAARSNELLEEARTARTTQVEAVTRELEAASAQAAVLKTGGEALQKRVEDLEAEAHTLRDLLEKLQEGKEVQAKRIRSLEDQVVDSEVGRASERQTYRGQVAEAEEASVEAERVRSELAGQVEALSVELATLQASLDAALLLEKSESLKLERAELAWEGERDARLALQNQVEDLQHAADVARRAERRAEQARMHSLSKVDEVVPQTQHVDV